LPFSILSLFNCDIPPNGFLGGGGALRFIAQSIHSFGFATFSTLSLRPFWISITSACCFEPFFGLQYI
jgi:hypothetical protein